MTPEEYEEYMMRYQYQPGPGTPFTGQFMGTDSIVRQGGGPERRYSHSMGGGGERGQWQPYNSMDSWMERSRMRRRRRKERMRDDS
jgi:hypothetical protein